MPLGRSLEAAGMGRQSVGLPPFLPSSAASAGRIRVNLIKKQQRNIIHVLFSLTNKIQRNTIHVLFFLSFFQLILSIVGGCYLALRSKSGRSWHGPAVCWASALLAIKCGKCRTYQSESNSKNNRKIEYMYYCLLKNNREI